MSEMHRAVRCPRCEGSYAIPVSFPAEWASCPNCGHNGAEEHEHVYRPVIVRHHGWEMISGFRCECGAPRPFRMPSAQEQIRWGLEYIRQRYGSPGAAWASFDRERWEELLQQEQLGMRLEAVRRGGYD